MPKSFQLKDLQQSRLNWNCFSRIALSLSLSTLDLLQDSLSLLSTSCKRLRMMEGEGECEDVRVREEEGGRRERLVRLGDRNRDLRDD